MIPVDADTRRLARMDSPQRIAWLRSQVHAYTTDLAVRQFFRLPTTCCDEEIPSPKDEALLAFIGVAGKHDLTPAECSAAFNAEWDAGMKAAVLVGDKLRMTALSHIKLTGGTAGLGQALRQARNRSPAHWPYLTDENLDAIAAGFRLRPKSRRAA